MRPRPSTFLELAVAASLLLSGSLAHAQACCAGSGALNPGRLALHDVALVGVLVRGTYFFGSYSPSGSYRTVPSGASEAQLEQNIFGTVRWLQRGQASLLVPFVETHRRAQGRSELGGGLGDVSVSGRYDFIRAAESPVIPGIGVVAGVSVPTGTAPDAATRPLATDATGIGAFEFSAGAGVEQSFGPVFLSLTALFGKRLTRTANGVRQTLGLRTTLLLGGGYVFPNEAAILGTIAYTSEGTSTIDGQDAPETGRRQTQIGVSGSYPIAENWRMQGNLLTHLPISQLGKNQPAGITMTVSVLRSF